ncbi:YaaL family protein [Aquibacillus salsiterrae]|uniref:YaaL family protein n=1 Tax=Aquibacillus salsiterrae TaxID=2950439 RepID=A0A9X4AFD4_9BACI|nr:YaaL family protein [Aquibacillus salsiterrae]MDC3417761.1 YaaL family protein [Aquibacillus salsiterrae]
MLPGKKPQKKKHVDQQLLDEIFQLKDEWMSLKSIIDRSFEPSETGLHDLAVAEAKYFYLLREARKRKVSALR